MYSRFSMDCVTDLLFCLQSHYCHTCNWWLSRVIALMIVSLMKWREERLPFVLWETHAKLVTGLRRAPLWKTSVINDGSVLSPVSLEQNQMGVCSTWCRLLTVDTRHYLCLIFKKNIVISWVHVWLFSGITCGCSLKSLTQPVWHWVQRSFNCLVYFSTPKVFKQLQIDSYK